MPCDLDGRRPSRRRPEPVSRGGRAAARGGRRRAAVVVALTMLVSACAGGPTAPHGCELSPAADVTTVPGWVGYVHDHPDDVAFVIDDGRGRRLEHRADAVQPMASASKVLTVVAYAREVALGHVQPSETVTVGDWERWSVLGNETSHARALDHLGIPRRGMHGADPTRTVTLDQVATQISIWSDDAGPDLLRARLGDRAVLDAAHEVGWMAPELISTTGFLVSLYTPELAPPASARAARRAAEWDLARRYATDPAFRADVDTRTVAPGVEGRWADGGPGGTARQLEAVWSAIGHGTVLGSDHARALVEQDPHPGPGIRGLGVKGGSLTGVLARGVELRRDDGSVATAVLLVRRMSDEDTRRVAGSGRAFDDVLVAAVQDPTTTAALGCP